MKFDIFRRSSVFYCICKFIMSFFCRFFFGYYFILSLPSNRMSPTHQTRSLFLTFIQSSSFQFSCNLPLTHIHLLSTYILPCYCFCDDATQRKPIHKTFELNMFTEQFMNRFTNNLAAIECFYTRVNIRTSY